MVSVEEMLKHQFAELGADGLCNSDGGCGCGVEELAPCECLNTECIAAKYITPKKGDADYWDEWPEGYYKALKEVKP
jgi:hypothetical protein